MGRDAPDGDSDRADEAPDYRAPNRHRPAVVAPPPGPVPCEACIAASVPRENDGEGLRHSRCAQDEEGARDDEICNQDAKKPRGDQALTVVLCDGAATAPSHPPAALRPPRRSCRCVGPRPPCLKDRDGC